MGVVFKNSRVHLMLAVLTVPASASLAQQPSAQTGNIVVNGVRPEAPLMTAGPEIKGVITARSGSKMKVTTADGATNVIVINDATRIRAASGLFGGGRGRPGAESLLNGLPVTVKTMQGGGELVASQITFRNNDLKTATMVRNGTSQRFEEQTAATEALRGRMGDIDKYNIKGTTNVHFDTGRTELSEQDKAALCSTASSAQATDNALLLVVGYTDSVGSDDFNQTLSEKRANRVINHLQQVCGWKPYRMLTPSGMAKADPAASNETEEGKAQNRRVAVNILVSKAVDGM